MVCIVFKLVLDVGPKRLTAQRRGCCKREAFFYSIKRHFALQQRTSENPFAARPKRSSDVFRAPLPLGGAPLAGGRPACEWLRSRPSIVRRGHAPSMQNPQQVRASRRHLPAELGWRQSEFPTEGRCKVLWLAEAAI